MSQAGHLARGLQMFLTTGAASEGASPSVLNLFFAFFFFVVVFLNGPQVAERNTIPMYEVLAALALPCSLDHHDHHQSLQ